MEQAGLVNGQMNDAMVNVLKDLVVEKTTQHLQAEEDRLDNMMQKLDNMDEDDLEKMREVRKRRLKREVWKAAPPLGTWSPGPQKHPVIANYEFGIYLLQFHSFNPS